MIFEHGDCCTKQKTCCICHAHTHILPTEKKILKILKETIEEPANEINSYTQVEDKIDIKEDSYLLIEENKKIYIWKNKIILHQYIRRIIAEQIGIASKYDWKRYPFYNNMQKTITDWLKYID